MADYSINEPLELLDILNENRKKFSKKFKKNYFTYNVI